MVKSPNVKDVNHPISPEYEEKQVFSEESDSDQILHLKRLLVTLKQYYEKNLETLHGEWQTEKIKRIGLESELEQAEDRISEIEEHRETEVRALINQTATLKELLKKTQAESESYRILTETSRQPAFEDQSRIVELEKIIADLRKKEEKQNEENRILRERFESASKKISLLESECNDRTSAPKTGSEIRGLEERYIEILNEKIESEHLAKNLSRDLEACSNLLESTQTRLTDLIEEKNRCETGLAAKESELASELQKIGELQDRIVRQTDDCLRMQTELEEMKKRNARSEELLSLKESEVEEKILANHRLQERVARLDVLTEESASVLRKFETVQNERKELEERLKEATELKIQAEYRCSRLDLLIENQDLRLQESVRQSEALAGRCNDLTRECDKMKNFVEETEESLKISQQHLAKKVKEVAILEEKLEEQEIHLHDLMEMVDGQKIRLQELNLEIERREKEEKQAVEELRRTLKDTEIQAEKWEEKYFGAYEQCQKNERELKELHKIKDKHFKMQEMLSKLETVMISPYPQPTENDYSNGNSFERLASQESTREKTSFHFEENENDRERFDAFGMRQTFDKAQSHARSR